MRARIPAGAIRIGKPGEKVDEFTAEDWIISDEKWEKMKRTRTTVFSNPVFFSEPRE